jgi:ferric-dicitrate binding protein FerR (iron transport regulator)
MSDALNRVLQDARRDWAVEATGIRWDAVEEGLFARIALDRGGERRSLAPGRGRAWTAVVAGLASAAAVAVVIATGHEAPSLDRAPTRPVEDATSIARIDGVGAALVNGRPAAVGTALKVDDVIEARGAQVTVSRPGKITLLVERGSSVVVKRVQGTLVLTLDRGAIEAQVVPVASDEALAVDIGPSRVAVHGTRFRVARAGDRVSLDLNEGVVAVGPTPRVGPTLGGVVIAPAHAEFAEADPSATLRVTHDPTAVRAPASFEAAAQGAQAAPPPTALAAGSRSSAGDVASPTVAFAPVGNPAGTPRPEPRPGASTSGWAGNTTADPNAHLGIAAAVRACFAEHIHADNITVMVQTTLFLRLHDDGSVGSARFEPPVAPEVNACSAEAIYRARFIHGGAVTIPITVKN